MDTTYPISDKHRKKLQAAENNYLEALNDVLRFTESTDTKNKEYTNKVDILNSFIKKLQKISDETLFKI